MGVGEEVGTGGQGLSRKPWVRKASSAEVAVECKGHLHLGRHWGGDLTLVAERAWKCLCKGILTFCLFWSRQT